MRHTKRIVAVAPVAVTIAALVAVGIGPNATAQDITPFDEPRALLADELNTIEIIDRFGASVVAVSVAVRGEAMSPFGAAPDGFFGDDMPVQQSSGSGFLIEFQGDPFLVTNFHVVEGALEQGSSDLIDGAEVGVTFPADPDASIPVDVVGVNPSFDLALMQLQDDTQLPDAPALAVADSDGLEVGQKTIAIGNPFGLELTVTSGIVSAVGRFVPTIGEVPVPMIQTDAAINPGNSGGPLLDSGGRLIGINTALINPQGRSFAGLGFAVPSNLLVESLATLETGGVTDVSDVRPRLGIAAQVLAAYPASIREDLGLPAEGVAVIDVQAGSVADKAGLLGSAETIDVDGFELPAPGDAIVAIDGEAIDSVEDITRKVTFESAAGDVLEFAIIRDGTQMEISVRLEVSTANAFTAAG